MSIRTTITLDDDVMAGLQEEARRRRIPFKEAVNETIRSGLRKERNKVIPPFVVKPLEMGPPLPGVNYDCSAELQALEDEERYR